MSALSNERQALKASREFREAHGLGVQPLGDLVELIEQTTRCDVAILNAEKDEHGLTMRDPARDTIYIGVACSRNPMRQRSTLAHELGHFVFGDWTQASEFERRPPEEIRADAFARHLLVPTEGVREFLGSIEVTEADLSAVVQRFLVSPEIAAIAIHDAGRISKATKDKWMQLRTPQLATKYGWMDHYGALQEDSTRLRAPQGLLKRAIAGYVEGVVTAQTIATLRGIPVNETVAELAAAGVFPIEREITDMDTNDLPPVDVDLSELDEGDSPSQ